MPQLLELLTILEQDNWFNRAWVLQQSVSANCEMTLSIQHNPPLHKSKLLGAVFGK